MTDTNLRSNIWCDASTIMKTKMRLPLPALYITPREKKFQKEEALLDSKSADDNTVNKDNSSDKNNTNLDLNSRKAGPPRATRASRITTALNMLNDTTCIDAPTVATNM